jgi:CBS domain-containing protein
MKYSGLWGRQRKDWVIVRNFYRGVLPGNSGKTFGASWCENCFIFMGIGWSDASDCVGSKEMIENLSQKISSENGISHEISLVIGPTEVADVMTGKVVTLSPHHSFNDAVNLMNDRHFRHCVVVEGSRKVVGVISDRDIYRTLARNPNASTKSLDQFMSRNPITVKRRTPIIDAVSKLVSKRINCLPVVEDDDTVCGIVTSTDLLKSYQQLLELVQKQAR